MKYVFSFFSFIPCTIDANTTPSQPSNDNYRQSLITQDTNENIAHAFPLRKGTNITKMSKLMVWQYFSSDGGGTRKEGAHTGRRMQEKAKSSTKTRGGEKEKKKKSKQSSAN